MPVEPRHLPVKFFTRLSTNDAYYIEALAKKAGVTPSQLARHVLKKFIREKIRELNPSLIGG